MINFALNKEEMAKKVRFYFETTEVTTTTQNRKGSILIDNDFTQVYDCFSVISCKLRSIVSIKLLFWMLAEEANKSNGISSSKFVFDKFNVHLEKNGSDKIAKRTFQSALDELISAEILSKVGRGHYYINPHVFWRDEVKKRTEFLIDEEKERRYKFKNPIPQNLLEDGTPKEE